MKLLRSISPLVEPLSLDEAFVDLEAADLHTSPSPRSARWPGAEGPGARGRPAASPARSASAPPSSSPRSRATSTSPTASSSSPRDGAGPATADAGHCHPGGRPGDRRAPASRRRTHRRGARTATEDELVRVLGRGARVGLYALARAHDDRSVEHEREAKSISVEDTYETDHVDKRLLEACWTVRRQRWPNDCARHGSRARRLLDRRAAPRPPTVSRSATLPEPSDDGRQIARSRDGCSPSWTPPAAYDCSAWVSPGSPTRSRRTSSPTTRTSRRLPTRPPRAAVAAASRHQAGPRVWTSSTTRTVAAGSGAPAEAWSRCGSRPPRPGQGRVLSFPSPIPRSRRSDRPKSDLAPPAATGRRPPGRRARRPRPRVATRRRMIVAGRSPAARWVAPVRRPGPSPRSGSCSFPFQRMGSPSRRSPMRLESLATTYDEPGQRIQRVGLEPVLARTQPQPQLVGRPSRAHRLHGNGRALGPTDRQHVALGDRFRAEAGQQIGRPRAQDGVHLDPTGDGQVGPEPLRHRTQLHQRSRRHRHRVAPFLTATLDGDRRREHR